MTYLITGGAGFIGSHLSDALVAQGARVRVLDDFSTGRRENIPPGAEIVEGDICDQAAVARAMEGISGCFHLAAIASVERVRQDPARARAVNLGGTETILTQAGRQNIPTVYASSAAIYGEPETIPVAEQTACHPLSAYGADKLACEQRAAQAGAATFGLRFFNLYGPRQDASSPYSGVISLFTGRIARGEGITVYGDGLQERDFVYVADAVAALRAAMSALEQGRQRYAVCNVATGTGITLLQLAEQIARLAHRQLRIEHAPPREGDIRRSIGDPARCRALLGAAPATPLAEGLARLLEA